MTPPKPGREPSIRDPADRTWLAWTRTAIAFAAIGAVMLKVSPAAGAVVIALCVPLWAVARSVRRSAAASASTRGLRTVTAIVVLVALAALAVAIAGSGPDSLSELIHAR